MAIVFPSHGIEFSIPALPVSVNAVWRKGKYGQIYKVKEADDFLWLVKANVRKPKIPLKGNLVLHVSFIFKDKRSYSRRDVSNMLKVLEDSLVTHGVLVNDNDIVTIHAQKLLGHQDCTSGYFDHTRILKNF